jgi:hypothetical protein
MGTGYVRSGIGMPLSCVCTDLSLRETGSKIRCGAFYRSFSLCFVRVGRTVCARFGCVYDGVQFALLSVNLRCIIFMRFTQCDCAEVFAETM